MIDLDKREKLDRWFEKEERRGHLKRVSDDEIEERVAEQISRGWVVFAVPMNPRGMLSLAEIEHKFYPLGTEANEGFQLYNLINCGDPRKSIAVASCKPFDGCREEFDRILGKHGAIFHGLPEDFFKNDIRGE